MLSVLFVRCSRCVNSGCIATTNIGNRITSTLGFSRNYANDKESCSACKNIAQTEGRTIEPWPKNDPPPPAWRPDCPTEPQPPNYDPYRIKVPEVVVPPLPPSNAKCTGVVFTHQSGGQGQHQGYNQHPGYTQTPGYQKESEEEKEEEAGTQGFFGYLKSLFGRGKKSGKEEGEEIPLEDAREFKGYETDVDKIHPEIQDMFRNSQIIHSNWRDKLSTKHPLPVEEVKEPPARLGYHGKYKYKYAFHEPWKPLDRLALLAQAEKEELEFLEEKNNSKNDERTDEQLT